MVSGNHALVERSFNVVKKAESLSLSSDRIYNGGKVKTRSSVVGAQCLDAG
jgi:hypothetical protein